MKRKENAIIIFRGLATTIFSVFATYVISLLVNHWDSQTVEETFFNTLTKQQIIVLSILVVLFFIFVGISFQIGAVSYKPLNVKDPIRYDYKKWQRSLGFHLVWSQFRLTLFSAIIVLLLIGYIGYRYSFQIEHYILIFIVIFDIALQFYSATGGVRNSLHQTIKQSIITLAGQIEKIIRDELGTKDFHFRIRVTIIDRDSKNLFIKYHLSMDGDPDIDLHIGVHQGVMGKVIKHAKPILLYPYDPKKLGLSTQQEQKIPQNLKWKMGFPLLFKPDKVFGVLAIDCDTDLDKEILNDIYSFTHPLTSVLSFVLMQFPSSDIQKAVENCSVDQYYKSS